MGPKFSIVHEHIIKLLIQINTHGNILYCCRENCTFAHYDKEIQEERQICFIIWCHIVSLTIDKYVFSLDKTP